MPRKPRHSCKLALVQTAGRRGRAASDMRGVASELPRGAARRGKMCDAVWCSRPECDAVRRSTTRRDAARRSATQRNAARHNTSTAGFRSSAVSIGAASRSAPGAQPPRAATKYTQNQAYHSLQSNLFKVLLKPDFWGWGLSAWPLFYVYIYRERERDR